jgi:hypothetical protein
MSIPAEEVPGRVFKQLIDQESESHELMYVALQ